MYRTSLAEGYVPVDWKSASIVPIHKKGDQQCVSNYKSVSVTPVICKILERVIRSKLLGYMLEKGIIPKNQHGFVPKKSTVTNLLESLNDWTSNFDEQISTDVLYLD